MPPKLGLMDRIGNTLKGVGRGVGAVGSGIGDILAAGGNAYAPQDLNLNRNQQMGLLSNVLGDMTIGPRGQRQNNTPGYLDNIRANQTRTDLRAAIEGMTDLTAQEKAIVLAMPATEQIAFVQEKLQYKYAPSSQNQAPSNVREWEYFNGLTEEQQQQFLIMKRANPYLNTGGSLMQPNPLGGGGITDEIPITYGPGDSPEDQALIERARGDEEVLTAEEIAENNARIAREEAVGERDIVRLDDFREDKNAFNQNMVDIDYLIQKGEEILAHPGFDMAFGFTRHALKGGTNIYGGTDATGLISTFKDNEFMEMIGRMREQSESGGAVGQVSEKEGERFENMLGDLRFETDEKQARANLERIVRELTRSKDLYRLGMENTYPELSESEDLFIEGYSAALPRTGAFRGAGLTQMQQLRLERGEDLEDSELTALTDEQLEVIVSAQERLGI